MRRLPIHQLDPGEATDGQVVTYDAATSTVAWADGSVTGGMPAGGTTGQVLTKLSAADYDAGWETPSAVGGSSIRDLRWYCPSGVTSYDEFNDDTLSGWTAIDPNTTANRAWTEGGDSLSAVTLGADTSGSVHAQIRSIGTALATGDAFATCQILYGPSALYTFGGLILSDSGSQAGTQIALTPYRGTSFAIGVWGLTSFAGGASIQNNAFTADSLAHGMPIHIRLVYLGGTTWRPDISADGITWRKGSTFAKASFTPTHVGVLVSTWGGTATQGQVSYDYVRRYAGVS